MSASPRPDWADRYHAQGGAVVIPHFPAPNGELAPLIATGRAGALEFGELQERAFIEYYRYLNAGFRLPGSGGTDKMSNEVPIGLSRPMHACTATPSSASARGVAHWNSAEAT
jgi:hypothetical protein